MAINVPTPHHDYVYFTDTEQSKDNIIQQAIDDNKEACYVGYGTGQLNSEYQPSPIKDPNYYMQYCNSDNYDYLRDYRLIWGYGIGISETEVIINVDTGEYLAEGTEACDSYIATEGVNAKRGVWLQFTGTTLINPSVIPSVNLPNYVISIKNLTNSLSSANLDIQQFNTENIINWDNAFSNKVVNFKDFTFDLSNCRSMNSTFNSSRISNYINNKATDFNFINVPENIIANNCFNGSTVNNNIHTLLTNYIGGIGMFQNTNNINIIDFTNCKLTLYSSMFYYNIPHYTALDITDSDFKCNTILENVFNNIYTNYFPKIDFSNVEKINVLFKFDAPNEGITYDINLSTLKDVPVTDIISCNFYKGYTTILNITAPDIKLTKYNNAFHISGCTINFLNPLKARNITDIINLYVTYDVDLNYFIYVYGNYPITLNGTFIGYNILYIDDFDRINGNVEFTYYDNIADELKEFTNINTINYTKFVSFKFNINRRTNNNIKESISSIGNCISGYNFPSPSVYTNITAFEIFNVDSIKTVNIDNTNYQYILPLANCAFCTMNYDIINIIEVDFTYEVLSSYIKFNVTNLSKIDNKVKFQNCIIDAENINFELYWSDKIYIRDCHDIKLWSFYSGNKVILKKFNNIISYKVENMTTPYYEQCTCFLDINNNNIINTEDGRVYIGYVGFYDSHDNITSIDDIMNSTLKGTMPTVLNPNNAELTYALYGRFDYKLSLLNKYFNAYDIPGFVDIYKDCNIINDTGDENYIVTLSNSNQDFYISHLCNDWSDITIDRLKIILSDNDFYNNIYLNDEYPAIIPDAIKTSQLDVIAKNTIINAGDSYAQSISIGDRYICDNLTTININIVRTCNYFMVNIPEHKNDKLINFNCTNINYIQHLQLPYCSQLSDESIAKIINTPPTNELQINEIVYNKLSEEDISSIISSGCSIISVSNIN